MRRYIPEDGKFQVYDFFITERQSEVSFFVDDLITHYCNLSNA
jgi:hypothetical protein